MNIQLRAYGRVDLDGSHKAIIETDLPDFKSSLKTVHNAPQFLKLQNAGRACGCMLVESKRGSANRIYLDRFKQQHLKIRDGGLITIEDVEFPAAIKVELLVPQDFSQRDIARFIGKPVVKNEKTALYSFSGEPRVIVVAATDPVGIVQINPNTEVITTSSEAEEIPVTYKEIGGLGREIKLIREDVEYPLRYPEVFEHLGVSQPRGIILYGPPGTGKTLIARALANEVGAKFYLISGPEIFSKWYGETEKSLRDIFNEAQKNAPSVILIDEIDALVPRRDKTHGELEQRVVASMLTLMDGLKQLKGVVVIGTTNRINSLDTALRREGRFGHEIHIGVPDVIGRKEILEIHTRRMPLSNDVNLDTIAEKTVGFVGADIASLCREAAYNTLRRSFPQEAFEKGQVSLKEELKISQSDFDNALPKIPPSAMKEFLVEIPKVFWEEIGGLEEIKRLLIENIAYAITKRDVFKKVGVKPARGILLYGPPGTGKTLLAKAVAHQCGANFIAIKGPEIRSKWVGESEERIRFIFEKAREVAPCVIFLDEIDAVVPARGRDASGVTDTIVNQILTEMDGIESAEGIFVIGATNRHELLDPAILRPGRFDYHIEVPLPDSHARKAIFTVHLKEKPLAKDVKLEELIELTDRFSGAEIAELCRESIWEAIRDADFEAEKVVITMKHFTKVFNKLKQSRDKLKPRIIGFKEEER
jgi:transitional endoplasmic reticulum ATPase